MAQKKQSNVKYYPNLPTYQDQEQQLDIKNKQ